MGREQIVIHTYSKRANEYIQANAKTEDAAKLSEHAVNIAISDVMNIVENVITELCPHFGFCRYRSARVSCKDSSCPYMRQYMAKIKQDLKD